MLKRLLGILLALSIAISVSVFSVSADNNFDEEECFTEIIDGKAITFTVYCNNGTRYVTFVEDGETHVVSYEIISGLLKLDGMPLSISPQAVLPSLKSINSTMSANTTYTWKYYQTTYSDITSDILTAVAWTGALIGLFGYTVPGIIGFANLLAQELYPTVYYKRLHYYINPIITSRPETASVYMFYSDVEYNDHLITFDLRPEI